MSICPGCPPEKFRYHLMLDVNRVNFCQMLTGFIKGWWYGDKTLMLNVNSASPIVVKDENGVQLWPLVSAGASGE